MSKPGWKSSEFWALIVINLAALAGALAGALPPKYAAIASSISAAGYAIARGLAKINEPAPPQA